MESKQKLAFTLIAIDICMYYFHNWKRKLIGF